LNAVRKGQFPGEIDCVRLQPRCQTLLSLAQKSKMRLERGSIGIRLCKRPVGCNAVGAFSSRGAAFKRASNVFTLACAGKVKSVKLAA